MNKDVLFYKKNSLRKAKQVSCIFLKNCIYADIDGGLNIRIKRRNR